MFEYTEAYLKPFSWAKNAYEYMLGRANQQVEISVDDLVSPSVSNLPLEAPVIEGSLDWNKYTTQQVVSLGGLYQSIDQLEAYFQSLFTTINSRLTESEGRVRDMETNLKVLLASYKQVASTSIYMKGGDTISIETDDKYYRDFGPLEAVPSEGIFRLKDTGSFSSIRSLGGFPGKAVIDFSLGEIVEHGNLKFVTDGSRNSFWAGTYNVPAPLKADQNEIPWLPSEYRHGFAIMLTYYLDAPTLATEVFIDPITTEPMDLVSVSWTPMGLSSVLTNGYFTSSGDWTYVGTASFMSSALGEGVGAGSCVSVTSSAGWITQTFALSGNYLASGSTNLVSLGRRCQIYYNMRGKGNTKAGVRVLWYNASGGVIDYAIKEDYPTGFYTSQRLVSYIPTNAVSGKIEAGIFTASVSASAYFDNIEVFIGEKEFQCSKVIDRPKTIPLPEIIRSSRISFVLAQRNPRRETLAKEGTNTPDFSIGGHPYLDPNIQKATEITYNRLSSKGPGVNTFAYRIGAKEIDLRYREHIPRGGLVSLPLDTRKEIRNIWLATEIGQFYNDNTKFYVYPHATDTQTKIEVSPFRIGEIDAATSYLIREGDTLRIFTPEEEAEGWVNPLDTTYIVSPRKLEETFEGTDREGKIQLSKAPHFRKVTYKHILDWLRLYGIWNSSYDPNLEVIYGLPSSMTSTIEEIRSGVITSFALSSLIAREGYLPLKVTVKTNKWTAVPDIFGRPDVSKVRTVALEELTTTTTVETTVDVNESVLGFETWMNTSTVAMLSEALYGANWQLTGFGRNNLFGFITNDSIENVNNLTLTQALEVLISKYPSSKVVYETFFRKEYEKLRASGKISKDSLSSRTTTSAVELEGVYATKYKPLISGPNGSLVQLYWYDETNNRYSIIPRTHYEISNIDLGLIKLTAAPPASSFTTVLADYKYLASSETEDHFGSILSLADAETTSNAANLGISSKPLPITRNMTDYENGRIPELRRFNMDKLSKEYYPVIEYYINSDGQLIFSTSEFYKYGDNPAMISIQTETLDIQPRACVEIVRSGSPAATPTIFSLSLRVRESSPMPLRESI